MSLRRRLQRLEQMKIDAGCPACRDRQGRCVFLTARKLPDGTVVTEDYKVEPCVRCGQIPELFIEVPQYVVAE